jgi:hypothetical protein
VGIRVHKTSLVTSKFQLIGNTIWAVKIIKQI